jgi:hypothetical protein
MTPPTDISILPLREVLQAIAPGEAQAPHRPAELRYEINLVRAWLKRKRATGEEPNADATWDYITQHWPTLSVRAREYIFQACEVRA